MLHDDNQAASTIQSNLPCVRCVYNLRGLSAGGTCPECGAPISESLRADLFRFADPSLVIRLFRGVVLKLCQIGIMLLEFIAIAVQAAVVTAAFEFGGSELLMLMTIVGCYGTFLFTSPGAKVTNRPRILRLATRWLMAAGGIAWLVALFRIGGERGIILALTAIGLLSFQLGMFLEIVYLAVLADSIPKAKMVRSFKRLAIVVVAIPIISIIAESLISGRLRFQITVSTSGWDFSWPGVYFMAITWVWLLTGTWYVYLLVRLGIAIHAELRVSRSRIAEKVENSSTFVPNTE